jgi:hypothetical protein
MVIPFQRDQFREKPDILGLFNGLPKAKLGTPKHLP